MTLFLEVIAWILLYIFFCLVLCFFGGSSDKLRSSKTILFHLIVLFLGRVLGQWLGIFFVSLPILVIFYWSLYHLAQVILPAREPELPEERWRKFKILLGYVWGVYYAHWVSEGSATRYSSQRIEGNYIRRWGGPGSILMHSHQVVACSTGIELNRIEGSGFIFTGRMERPVALVDLRMQLRPTPFVAVTEDGIEINAIIFIAFQIDRRDWSNWGREKKHAVWRENPALQQGMSINSDPYISFPFSEARVRAALSASSIDSSENNDQQSERFWDEVAVQRVLGIARLVLSERKFDELWVPRKNDSRGAGAIDEMSNDILDRAKIDLEKMGVELFSARIVNFSLEEDSSVYQQLKDAWLFKWDKKIEKIKFEGEAEAEKLKMRAKMDSRRVFMDTISETLQRAKNIDKKVLQQLTTLNFISTLEKLIEDMEEYDNVDQQTARISAWGRFVSRNNRDR